jgi:hypothetical protein
MGMDEGKIRQNMAIKKPEPAREILETERDFVLNHPRALELLEQGNPRMAQVIRLRFLDNKIRKEIATELGVSISRIVELEKTGIDNLKRIVGGKHLSKSKPRAPEEPETTPISPEKKAALEKIPLGLFVCFYVKASKTILVDFSMEFYRKSKGINNMQYYMSIYRNRDLPQNQNEEFKKELRKAVMEIRAITGFSAEDLFLKKEKIVKKYKDGTMSQDEKILLKIP